jgi:hypothetical protein
MVKNPKIHLNYFEIFTNVLVLSLDHGLRVQIYHVLGLIVASHSKR